MNRYLLLTGYALLIFHKTSTSSANCTSEYFAPRREDGNISHLTKLPLRQDISDGAPPQSDEDTHGNHPNKSTRLTSPSLLIRKIMRLSNITVEEFEEEYSPPEVAVPIVFENAMNDVFNAPDWTREAILKECGNIKLIDKSEKGCDNMTKAAADRSCHKVQFVNTSLLGEEWASLQTANLTEFNITTMADLLALQNKPGGSHLYLHDAALRHYCPPAAKKIRVPKYFHTDYRKLQNDPDLVHEMEMGHFPDIFISKKGTGSPLHCDGQMTRFYFQLLSGKKLWRVIPPSDYWRAGPVDRDNYYPTHFEADIINPDFEKFPDLNGALVYETVLSPGDVIFVPEGWGHQVYNLEDSIATSLNFVDWHALPAYLRYMEDSKGLKFEKSYFYRLMTSYIMPLDIPDREHPEDNIEIDEWLNNHHYYSMDVPESVEDWVEFMTEYGHGLDSYRTKDGFPALHVAVQANFRSVVEYLLIHGASLYERDYLGRTAMDVADELEHYEIFDELDWHRRYRGSKSFRKYIDSYTYALF